MQPTCRHIPAEDYRPSAGDRPHCSSLRGIARPMAATRAMTISRWTSTPGEVMPDRCQRCRQEHPDAHRLRCTRPDEGSVAWNGTALDPHRFSARAAQSAGHPDRLQDCRFAAISASADNSTLNARSLPAAVRYGAASIRPRPRQHRGDLSRRTSFHSALVADFSLAARQMVEMPALPTLRCLLILDEPTVLAWRRAQRAASPLRPAASGGRPGRHLHQATSWRKVLDVSDRVIAMRNGQIVWRRDFGRGSVPQMVEAMGGPGAHETPQREARSGAAATGDALVTLDRLPHNGTGGSSPTSEW
ncbi:hypothetical protein F2981_24245 (plasmid) [Sinorhizobium meliloti]|nr:hypothetical protein [Sinorhizobium meliloti]